LDENALANAFDVEAHYLLFLGRLPEHESVVRNKIGEPIEGMYRAFLTSSEFRDEVYQPIFKRQTLEWTRFRRPVDARMKQWIKRHFRLSQDEEDAFDASDNWYEILAAIYRDGTLLGESGMGSAPDLKRFIDGLDDAAKTQTQLVGSFDALRGTFASGWIWDHRKPTEAASVEFLLNGEVIHTEKASFVREDVRELGFGEGLVGFQTHLPLDLSAGEPLTVSARLAGTGEALRNSPQIGSLPEQITAWMNRKGRVVGAKLEKLRNRLDRRIGNRTLSIVMPVYDVRGEWLEAAIESVRAQWCTRWELICVDDASPKPHIRQILESAAEADPRIRPLFSARNAGIASTTNAGIAVARGDYIAFMDHDDLLEPNAVFHMLNTSKTGADLIYSDEILTADNIDDLEHPQTRPAFSWDYYISHPYFVHMVCVRAELARAIGGLDEGMTISADVDFILRALERTRVVAHVPAILYRWRTHSQSTGHAKQADVTDATLGALNRHLARVFPGARAISTPLFNQFRVDFADDHGKTLIVIPTKNRSDLLKVCIESIRRTTNFDDVVICVVDHDSDDKETKRYLKKLRETCLVVPYSGAFNYPKINNHAVNTARELLGWLPRYILLANNDIEAVEPGWLERMRSLARRPDVGVVGATLLYANRTVQHSGVTLGLNGSADHAHKFSAFYNPDGSRVRGHLQSLVSTRDYSAVTAACMLMRTAVYEEIGGFDERFEIGFNDTDLCLRIGETGRKIINDGESVLIHHESATRSTSKQLQHPADDELLKSRWHRFVYGGDPFYSPLFNAWGISHQVGAFSTPCVKPRLQPGMARFPMPYEDAPEGDLPTPQLSLIDRLLNRKRLI
jgi:GT2 family glycosyltransferase